MAVDVAAPPRSARGSLRLIATVLVGSALVLFQLNFAAFIGDQPRTSPIGVAYYGLFAAIGLTAAWVLLRKPGVWMTTWPALVLAVAACAPMILHPVGQVEKGFLEDMALFAAIAVLAGSLPRRRVAYMAAAITATTAGLCLVDIWRPVGLTYIDSIRGAALLGNPNIAAISLLLGALITLRILPNRVRVPFLILVAAGMFATLSRSTMIVAAVVMTGSVGVALVRRQPLGFKVDRPSIAIAALLAAWIIGACVWNPGFERSIVDAIHGAQSATLAGSAVVHTNGQTDNSIIASIQQEAKTVGAANSATARSMLLLSSIDLANRRPVTGYGLTKAQAIAPHNSFMLFALAFGWGGIVIPLALVGLLAFYARQNGHSFAIPVALFGIMLASHDLMLSTDLAILLPLAFVALSARTKDV